MVEALTARMSDLLTTGRFSDFTIECGEAKEVFKVHKMVLCPASSYFSDVCLNGEFEESRTGKVHLADTDPEVLRCALQYVYTGKYASGELDIQPGVDTVSKRMWFHAKVYILADYISVDSLRYESLKQFQTLALDITRIDTPAPSCLDLFQHILANTAHTDTGIRPVLLQFGAIMRPQKDFGVLEELLMTEEPFAWILAKQMRQLILAEAAQADELRTRFGYAETFFTNHPSTFACPIQNASYLTSLPDEYAL
ncbi:hypothetical protein LTR66_017385, partial [Elasticomyces elasticus]